MSLLLLISGLIIGLGAVTVIDLHGFLGKNSGYWTEATIRTHKVTKPLIWLGICLYILGLCLTNYYFDFLAFFNLQVLLIVLLILNGLFLSFYVSPLLLNLEKAGKGTELLSKSLQTKITISFIFSFIGWWGSVALLAYSLALALV